MQYRSTVSTARGRAAPAVTLAALALAVELASAGEPRDTRRTLGVRFIEPTDGGIASVGRSELVVRVDETRAGGAVRESAERKTLVVESDRDGIACVRLDEAAVFRCPFVPATIGPHRITATAVDARGARGSATISVAVANGAPRVVIAQPAEGTAVAADQPVRFAASLSDEDQAADAVRLVWTSDVDGDITPSSSAREFERVLSPGMHLVTASATDGSGARASQSIRVHVIDSDAVARGQLSRVED